MAVMLSVLQSGIRGTFLSNMSDFACLTPKLMFPEYLHPTSEKIKY